MKKKRKAKYVCVLCKTSHESDEHANVCLWIHIIRNDKYLKALNKHL